MACVKWIIYYRTTHTWRLLALERSVCEIESEDTWAESTAGIVGDPNTACDNKMSSKAHCFHDGFDRFGDIFYLHKKQTRKFQIQLFIVRAYQLQARSHFRIFLCFSKSLAGFLLDIFLWRERKFLSIIKEKIFFKLRVNFDFDSSVSLVRYLNNSRAEYFSRPTYLCWEFMRHFDAWKWIFYATPLHIFDLVLNWYRAETWYIRSRYVKFSCSEPI